jgi:hypothetical protein
MPLGGFRVVGLRADNYIVKPGPGQEVPAGTLQSLVVEEAQMECCIASATAGVRCCIVL